MSTGNQIGSLLITQQSPCQPCPLSLPLIGNPTVSLAKMATGYGSPAVILARDAAGFPRQVEKDRVHLTNLVATCSMTVSWPWLLDNGNNGKLLKAEYRNLKC